MLSCKARLRVVRAAPGSGKTWLVAEFLRGELAGWNSKHSGIAAVSFTNVAHHEICRQLGATPSHPHFIGTLDSFLFRYVVRPFMPILYPGMPTPRILDASRVRLLTDKQSWNRASMSIQVGTQRQRAHLYEVTFHDMQDNGPAFAAAIRPRNDTMYIEGNRAAQLMRAKENAWRSSGYVSHSDSAFLAARILTDDTTSVRAHELLDLRFPIVVVDELQDTSKFHAVCVDSLLRRSTRCALAVGDPDQSIFQFAGSDPQLFDSLAALPGAETIEMERSRRCPAKICAVAQALACGDRQLRSLDDREGAARMVIYDTVEEARAFVQTLRESGAADVQVLTRGHAQAKKFRPTRGHALPRGLSRAHQRLHEAAVLLRAGDLRKAYVTAECVLARLVLDSDTVEPQTLRGHDISPQAWRREVVAILQAAAFGPADELLSDWCVRVTDEIKTRVQQNGWDAARLGPRLKRPPKEAEERHIRVSNTNGDSDDVPLRTIHSAKGETIGTVVVLVPNEGRSDRCPSQTWWRDTDEDLEERRVAFVACSRAQDTLVLLTHRKTYERLSDAQPEFLGLFDLEDVSGKKDA